jgi:thiosulfate/3-mercaptopyruvate sulfurtransferase
VSALIQVEVLAQQIDDPRLRLFDCRFELLKPDAGRDWYETGHLPGAIYADLDRNLSAPRTPASGRHPLPTPAAFQSWLRQCGVNEDSRIVAYDAGNGMYAARLWWMMRWVGHEGVAVLEGGLGRWTALGLPVERGGPAHRPGNFVARPRPELVADASAVLAAAGSRAQRVVDVRAPERYRGDVEPIDPVAGHVPGAVNQPFTASVAADGRFRPAAELRAMLAAPLGDATPRDAIAMCGSGVTACHLLLAMEVAGLRGARLYAGSWSEWCRDPSRPVARGPDP